MRSISIANIVLLMCASLTAVPAVAQVSPGAARTVRRTIPMTQIIKRAHQAGTRDSTGNPGRNYWQLRVDYDIDARLDVRTSIVSGREKITLHNTSRDVLNRIVLRLDQNIYAPNAARQGRVGEATEGMKVSRITLNGESVRLNAPGLDHFHGLDTVSIPTVIGIESTLATIVLPARAAISPQSLATLEVAWEFRVPLGGMRMGRWADSVYQVAQWYPRIAKYDDSRGWSQDPYLGISEFYNNYGSFDVTLDLPEGWLVGATGVLQNPQDVLTSTARERLAQALRTDSLVRVVESRDAKTRTGASPDKRLRWHFKGDSISDFAWAASDRYVWDATRANISEKGFIPVNVLYSEANRHSIANFDKIPAATRHSLEFYSKLWMPYAYPQLTVADGPNRGMEYPMFILSGLYAADHEVGHQWWPMMVGNNETWYPWMDEGFTTYMEHFSKADAQKKTAQLNGLGQQYGQLSGNENEATLMSNANYGGPMYAFQGYMKAPMMLSMLGAIVSDTAVARAQAEFARTWRLKHPTPWDYMFSMNRSLGRDLDWFWYYWLFANESSNGAIASVTTAPAGTSVVVRQDGEMPAPIVLEVEYEDKTAQRFTYPVDVWFSGSRTFTATLDTGSRAVVKVQLDPDARFPDDNPANNVWNRGAK